jgi:hypothetical protein
LSETEKGQSYWRSFLTSPAFTSIASFASIISLLLAIYVYYGGKQSPELTFSINPVKLEIVNAKQTSKLSVSFDGKPVNSDITTTQVAIWNRGKTPIRRSDILKPIVIYTDPKTPILEASLRKASRDVINFSLSSDELQQGRVPVSWEVLEQGDGGMIELIYAGSPDIDFKVEGTIIGQNEIIRYENKIGFQSPNEEYEALRTQNKRIRFISLPFAMIMLFGLIVTLLKIVRPPSPPTLGGRKPLIIIAVLLVMIIGIFISLFIISRYPIVPPGL